MSNDQVTAAATKNLDLLKISMLGELQSLFFVDMRKLKLYGADQQHACQRTLYYA